MAYHNSFDGVFLLDDKIRIVGDPQIRQLSSPWAVMAHSSRPVVQLSLAINYALGGLNVWGYHAFNLIVHLLAGLTLFGIVGRMLESDRLRPRYERAAPWMAAAVALIWIVHPLQTQSVTYVIQRAESMMGLFFLLTLYCGIRGTSSPHPHRWHFAAIVACALGMGSKEVMVTAPVIMLLYDRVFIARSFADILRQRLWFYAGLAATWLILGALMANSRVEQQTILVEDVTPWRYALTQFAVIVHYLRLSFWPVPLVLDYAWRPVETVASAMPWIVVILALLSAIAWALYRNVWLWFWGAWVFLILAPTSSIVPIADLAFEHRMYLPLAGVVVLVVIGVHETLQWGLARLAAPDSLRRGAAFGLLTIGVLVLAFATIRRNDDYRSEYAMWSGIVANRPDNPRARYNLGNILDRQGKLAEAMAQFSEALRLKPDYADAHVNLGAALLAQNKWNEAMPHLSEAVRVKPNSAEAHTNLGTALFNQGQLDEAIIHFSTALRINPRQTEAKNNLDIALARKGPPKPVMK